MRAQAGTSAPTACAVDAMAEEVDRKTRPYATRETPTGAVTPIPERKAVDDMAGVGPLGDVTSVGHAPRA